MCEISNFKHHYSGHLYITLKDEGGVLKAVMFRGSAQSLNFEPSDGMKVLARGRVSVYEAGGSYQLYIEEMIPDGVGELYIAYEQLKKKDFSVQNIKSLFRNSLNVSELLQPQQVRR